MWSLYWHRSQCISFEQFLDGKEVFFLYFFMKHPCFHYQNTPDSYIVFINCLFNRFVVKLAIKKINKIKIGLSTVSELLLKYSPALTIWFSLVVGEKEQEFGHSRTFENTSKPRQTLYSLTSSD